jgi:hypothetical protein
MKYHQSKLRIAGANFQHTQSLEFRLDLADSYRDHGDALVARKEVQRGLEELRRAHSLLVGFVESPDSNLRALNMQASVLKSVVRANSAKRNVADLP